MTESDEEIFRMQPSGRLYSMIMAAAVKRWLTETDSIEQRLAYLEFLNNSVDSVAFTPAMMRAIEPMTDGEYSMFSEAMALSRGHKDCSPTFDFLGRLETFREFARVNAGYKKAMDVQQREWAAHARLFPPIEAANNHPAWEVPHVPASLPLAAREMRVQVPGFSTTLADLF